MRRADQQLVRTEIDLLRREIQLLSLRLDSLEERSFSAEAEGSERSRLREEVRSQSPSCVSRRSEARSSWTQVSSNRSTVLIEPEDRAGRKELARTIGEFIRRSLDGRPGGPSGRIQLETPLFTDKFSEVKAITKRGNGAGSSVFVGLPTLWESKIVLQTAGFPLPQRLRDA